MWNAPKLLLWTFVGMMPANLHAAERITAEVETKPAAKLSAEESRALSLAAAEILKQVDKARVAIGKKDLKSAGRHVDQGLLLVRIINEAVPEFKVETKIKAGQLAYVDSENSKPRIVPIYDELQRVSVRRGGIRCTRARQRPRDVSAGTGAPEPRRRRRARRGRISSTRRRGGW